jgi:hypothetical protein
MSEFPRGRGRWSDRAKTALAVVSVPLFGLVAAAAGPSAAPPRAVEAVPANQAATSAVALAAESGGFDDAFYRGQDGAVYQRTFRDGVWSAQTASVGGSSARLRPRWRGRRWSSPSAAPMERCGCA